MIVDLSKKDVLRLLRGTSPSYEKMNLIPKQLGSYVGGFVDDFKWDISIFSSDNSFPEYSTEYLYGLYLQITENS